MAAETEGMPEKISGEQLRHALRDIIGNRAPKDLTIEFEKPLRDIPGGLPTGDPTWEGNIYKYTF
jgi:hypothetical protein